MASAAEKAGAIIFYLSNFKILKLI